MFTCGRCQSQGFCVNRSAKLFTIEDIRDPLFLADFKAFLVRYSFEQKLTPSMWHEHVCDLYRDYSGWIKDENGEAVFLDLDVFEAEHIREWFRDFIEILPEPTLPRLGSPKRVQALATIMRAFHPTESLLWGVRVANDT